MKHWKEQGSYGTVGLEIIVSILFGFLIGRWLDGRFGTHPYLTMVGFVFGMGTAVRFLVRATRRMKRETERDDFKASDTDRDARYAMNEAEKRSADD